MLFPYQLWAGFIFMLIFKNLSFKCSYCESISYYASINLLISFGKLINNIVYPKSDKEICNLRKQVNNKINHINFLQIPIF